MLGPLKKVSEHKEDVQNELLFNKLALLVKAYFTKKTKKGDLFKYKRGLQLTLSRKGRDKLMDEVSGS